MSDTVWEPLGAHRVRLEDDTIVLETGGELTLEDMKGLFDRYEQSVERSGYALYLVDATRGLLISSEGTRYAVDYNRAHPAIWSLATFGAAGARGLLTRTGLALFLQALRLVSARQVPVHFAATEAEARAWLQSERQGYRDRASRKRSGELPRP